jgi:tetratricopeptide (TPR) repeat protein
MTHSSATLARLAFPGSRSVFGALAYAVVLAASAPAAAEPAGAPPAASSADRERQARKHYEDGAAAFDAGQYHEAVAQFQAADALAPRAPLSFNIARAYELASDPAGALKYYREYLRREPAASNVDVVRGRIGELESVLAGRGVQQLTVFSRPPGAFLSVDGQPSGVTPWTGELAPGKHRLVLTREGYSSVARDYELEPKHASELEVPLAIAPPSSPSAPLPRPAPTAAPARHTGVFDFGPWPWVVLGAGGATLLASGGMELARHGAEHDAKQAATQIAYNDAYQREQGRQTAARVLVGVGGALVLAGGALLVIEYMPHKEARVAAACDGTGCTGVLTGSF